MHARVMVNVLLVLLSVTVAHADETHWQRVMSGDRKVGFVEHTRRVEAGRVFTSERLTLELGKSGRRVTYRVSIDTESTTEGALLRLVRDAVTREGHSRLEARVTGTDLQVDIGAGKNPQSRVFPGAGADLRTDEFARAWLRTAASGAAAQPLRWRTFDPAKAAVAEIELSVVGSSPVRVRRQLRADRSESATLQTLGPEGQVVEESLRMGGLQLDLVAATQAEANSRNQPVDHVVAQFQKSPYRIPPSGLRAKIRYGFDNGGRAPAIPVGAGQRSWTDGQTTWIQVCADCAADETTLSDDARLRALLATPWLNFDDPVLSRHARRIADGSQDPVVTMRRLTNAVRQHMSAQQIDMLGYGSALEAFKSRRGDCTEYAVLLAAMGRAAGVPTRVASGLVYAQHFEGQRYVFVPHVWVHAWTGSSWQSFDAALGKFDSTHLAFATSDDGNPSELFAGLNLAHELRMISAARVLPRAAAGAE